MSHAATLACDLIRGLEGCVLVAYPDPASPLGRWKAANPNRVAPIGLSGAPWTIGYGATGPAVKPGVRWTQQQADADLLVRVAELVRQVRELVKVDLPDGAHAALVSLAYNIGVDLFTRSTLLRRINAGEVRGAADEFPKFIYAKGKVFAPLVKRRDVERKAFLAALNAAGNVS